MTTKRPITRVTGRDVAETTDAVVTEAPIEFRLGDTPIAVLMRTPGADAELGLGFAITEGIVLGPNEIAEIRAIPAGEDDERWEIRLAQGVTVDPEQFRRNVYTSSSCGVCGKASIDAVRIAAPPPPPGPDLTRSLIGTLPVAMRAAQSAFETTGGIHAASIFDGAGTMLTTEEDIGRHNAVDKAVGRLASTRWPLGETILMVSGRVSFEMVQKAAVAGIPVVCGVSAASSLAAELGDELGITVVGFVRDDGFNVYSHPTRFTDLA